MLITVVGGTLIVDYYSELSLDRSKKIDEINMTLSRLESTWKRREITNPEKADPDKECREALDKWKEQARPYYESGQCDLAKIAVEKALSLSGTNGDDDVLSALAADIYNDNGDQNTALEYINRAIVAAPDVSGYYISKGLIYDQNVSTVMQGNGYGRTVNFRSEARKMFWLAETKAEQNGDLINRALACGALAFSLYFLTLRKYIKVLGYFGVWIGQMRISQCISGRVD